MKFSKLGIIPSAELSENASSFPQTHVEMMIRLRMPHFKKRSGTQLSISITTGMWKRRIQGQKLFGCLRSKLVLLKIAKVQMS